MGDAMVQAHFIGELLGRGLLRLTPSRNLAMIYCIVTKAVGMSLISSPPASARGQLRALWFLGPGNAAILPETYAMCSGDGVCLVRSFYSAVSSGSERLVLAGRVPPDLHPSMRV